MKNNQLLSTAKCRNHENVTYEPLVSGEGLFNELLLMFFVFQVKSNIITPRNGEPLIAATQDFITGKFGVLHLMIKAREFLLTAANSFD